MAFLTTNPSPFLINVPELQNVQNSATGGSSFASLSNTVNDILTYINTANSQININTIGSQTSGSITFTSNINLSNSAITFLGSNLVGSNFLNGVTNYMAFQVNNIEQARLTSIGLGIGTIAPGTKLDVNGNVRISGNLGIGTLTPTYPLDVQGSGSVSGVMYAQAFNGQTMYASTIGGATFNGVSVFAQSIVTSTIVGTSLGGSNIDVSTIFCVSIDSTNISGRDIVTSSIVGTTFDGVTFSGRDVIVSSITSAAASLSSMSIGLPYAELPFDVQGGAIVRGPLYVSSFGAVSSQVGNIIASGDMFANGFFYPSDPVLKRDVQPYIPHGLPSPVEFVWRSSGLRDIGVLADEVAALEPACVTRSIGGTLNVDYPKLTVLLLAEVHGLKAQMSTLTARLP